MKIFLKKSGKYIQRKMNARLEYCSLARKYAFLA